MTAVDHTNTVISVQTNNGNLDISMIQQKNWYLWRRRFPLKYNFSSGLRFTSLSRLKAGFDLFWWNLYALSAFIYCRLYFDCEGRASLQKQKRELSITVLIGKAVLNEENRLLPEV